MDGGHRPHGHADEQGQRRTGRDGLERADDRAGRGDGHDRAGGRRDQGDRGATG